MYSKKFINDIPSRSALNGLDKERLGLEETMVEVVKRSEMDGSRVEKGRR